MKRLLACTYLSALLLTGCGSSGSGAKEEVSHKHEDEHSHEHSHSGEKRTLIFYSSDTNDHYAYNLAEKEITNLNEKSFEGEDISNFNLLSNEKGKPFIWLDNKGDSDESNDEQKIIMFKDSYSYEKNGDATWEDFYYLGHFHKETENGKTHYHLAAHKNSEFNVTSGKKVEAIKRLNTYLKEQNDLEKKLEDKISKEDEAEGLCGFIKYEDHKKQKEFIYAMAQNGKLFIYNEDLSKKIDEVTVSSSCTKNKMGLSTIENGVWVYLNHSKKIYIIDTHGDGVYHKHATLELNDYLGEGKDATSMVSLVPAEGHEH